jgi:hypothetical protein
MQNIPEVTYSFCPVLTTRRLGLVAVPKSRSKNENDDSLGFPLRDRVR